MSYGGNNDRGPFLNTLNWVLTAIALTLVILRLVSQRMSDKKAWSLDDALVVFAMAVILARAILVSTTISSGFGRHLDDLLQEDPVATTQLLRHLVILQAIGLWTFSCPKLPIAALLVRLFGIKKIIRVTLWSMAGALIVLAAIVTITTFAQCHPVAAQWDIKIEGKCWPRSVNVNIGYLLTSYSVFLDCSFALYPIIRISKLQMERSRKILISASLSLGFIAAITTSYKASTIAALGNQQDPTWATIPLEVWNSVESCSLIIAVSVPLTWPLILRAGRGFVELTSLLSLKIRSISRSSHVTSSSRGAGYQIQGSKDNIPLQRMQNTVTAGDSRKADFRSEDDLDLPKEGIRMDNDFSIRTQDTGPI